jgi:hypothetical protein
MDSGGFVKPRKMYLDVDGVLVVWDKEHNCIELARGFGRLMRFCRVHEITPCWLTLWSKRPETLEGINCLLWPKSCPTMAAPGIVDYGGGPKAAAIDYASDFVWIEDGLGERDRAILAGHHALDRFFPADGLDPDCLLKFMEFTRRKMALPEIADWGPNWESFFTRPRGTSF